MQIIVWLDVAERWLKVALAGPILGSSVYLWCLAVAFATRGPAAWLAVFVLLVLRLHNCFCFLVSSFRCPLHCFFSLPAALLSSPPLQGSLSTFVGVSGVLPVLQGPPAV